MQFTSEDYCKDEEDNIHMKLHSAWHLAGTL